MKIKKLNLDYFTSRSEANRMCVELARKNQELIESNNILVEEVEALKVLINEIVVEGTGGTDNLDTIEYGPVEDYKTGKGVYTFPDGKTISGVDDARDYLELLKKNG